ncbi:MAG: VOC family protein, partial [Pseudomonadota bacterium]
MADAALSPYIAVSDAAAAIEFYVSVFNGEEAFRLVDPTDGRIGHAQIAFGDASMMISDAYPEFGALTPDAVGGTPVKLHLYVDDVDAVFAAATARGATELRPVKDQFHGDRSGMLA